MSATQQVSGTSEPTIAGHLLEVEGLTTTIKQRRGSVRPVDGVSFSVARGEILGLVGESGCGKSMTALSLMRLLPASAAITGGTVHFDSRDLLAVKSRQMRHIRGREISMVFQEPMSALDPAFSIGYQLIETLNAHESMSRAEARDRSVSMLQRVGIANAASRLHDYPHQFSGGMRQRVMLAMALLMKPKLLLADEPTTALDVTVQSQILDLIAQLQDDFDLSVILITHNLGVVHEIADRVAVMYAGEIVEVAPTKQIFENPLHPYTQGLLLSMPDLAHRRESLHVIQGRVPELNSLPPACRFAPRCPNRIAICEQTHPLLEATEVQHELRCYNPTPIER
ncbi:MAG: ABC transporter ATP-binding protein [Candidatus Dormibacteraeota bacterium]|nr:ABC transporter ATP-binding protein [Candidatus Dormibacteraeota bacterium]